MKVNLPKVKSFQQRYNFDILSSILKKTFFFLNLSLIVTFFVPGKIWAQKKLVYQGHIYNIFFHPLIVYPELAFKRSNPHLSYMDDWFVTRDEFKKIILEIYQRGFILVSPKDLFEEKVNSKGQLIITRRNFSLPEGKKPLILSLDDYNFYNTMKRYGTIHRFSVNAQGMLVTITNKNNAPAIIKQDQEIPQLLEKFIIAHPDFAFNNARGIIALTGYNGIFGYDTHKISAKNYPFSMQEAEKVVKKLKKMGWEFASHSYFHKHEKEQTEQVFESSEKRWAKEVGSIVGPTSYYIFPYGDSWDENPIRKKFLKSMGYKYLFSVSQVSTVTIQQGNVVMERFPMDGRCLRGRYAGSNVYISPADILDASRLRVIH